MIRITFLSIILTPTLLNGESPSWPLGIKNECTKLIREGGQIACNLTGEGDYYSMSITNCWVTCTRGFNMFMLPDPECKRVLESYAWDGYQKLFGKLPPYGFEDCDQEDIDRLRKWVKRWREYREIAIKAMCSKKLKK
uniref:Putative salivary secreted protein n=1 Tax=Ixodes ricinus TaxID=34613 RepID=A0A6B0UTY1_IXORI